MILLTNQAIQAQNFKKIYIISVRESVTNKGSDIFCNFISSKSRKEIDERISYIFM